MEHFFTSLARELGNYVGGLVGVILVIIGYILVMFLFWGLWWERILSKAGFTGQSFNIRFALLFLPVLIVPPSLEELYFQAPAMAELLSFIGGLAVWLGIVLTALSPWPTRKRKVSIINSK